MFLRISKRGTVASLSSVICCGPAKFDSHMKSKSLASQNYSYGILLMDGKNMIAEISARSSIFSL